MLTITRGMVTLSPRPHQKSQKAENDESAIPSCFDEDEDEDKDEDEDEDEDDDEVPTKYFKKPEKAYDIPTCSLLTDALTTGPQSPLDLQKIY